MQGSCLCGAVLYEVEAPALLIGHCSCWTCRKAHAAPFTTTARVARDRHVILRVATLDDDPGTRPIVHSWRSHEVPWLAGEGDIKSFDEWPPGK